ncbi:ABC transporter permease [Pontibacillus salicampi]|uniref:ABC transporter permease n=1 Tax=Pontibacillus salicampi TaxID=1449801 RepID=A0ABV6LMI6_9BACI
MKLLIRNELMKMKRLKMVYVILVLSFLPYFINTGGMMLMAGGMDAEKYYFFVFNQYAILFPTLVFIFAGFFFYTEFQNKTTLNWISYPYHNFSLLLSKVLACSILLMATSFLNHALHTLTIGSLFDIGFGGLITRFLTSMLFSGLTILIVPLAALLAFSTRNILSVVIAGVASIFVTTILLGADFGIVFPFSFIYRFSIQYFDASMGYENQDLVLGGCAILAGYLLVSLFGLYRYSKMTRMST